MEKLQPLVSVCTVTYNHAPYISKCLDGIMMQQTDFPFEVLIHDDASTDGTQDIIREYEARYPDIIKPIYQKENQYSKGAKISTTYQYPRARGKYIALCEGDDYWTDPHKLQLQVDFLESHPDYVMCSHAYEDLYEDGNEKKKAPLQNEDYSLADLVCGEWPFQTLTVVFRKDALDVAAYGQRKHQIDAALFYGLLKRGKGHFEPRFMGVYRHQGGGVWSGSNVKKRSSLALGARLEICEKSRSLQAAVFLLSYLVQPVSRVWLLNRRDILLPMTKVLYNHFGLSAVLKIYYRKFILNRTLQKEYLRTLYDETKVTGKTCA